MLSESDIKSYHTTLLLVCDPKSPFYGKMKLQKILRLPIEDQKKIYTAMTPKLKKTVDAFMRDTKRKVLNNA